MAAATRAARRVRAPAPALASTSSRVSSDAFNSTTPRREVGLVYATAESRSHKPARRPRPGRAPRSPAGRRAVQVEQIPDSYVDGRDHERLRVDNESDMAMERLVEDGIDRLALVEAPLGMAAHAAALGQLSHRALRGFVLAHYT